MKISDCFNVYCKRDEVDDDGDVTKVSCSWIDDSSNSNNNILADSMSALIQVNVVIDKNVDDDDHEEGSTTEDGDSAAKQQLRLPLVESKARVRNFRKERSSRDCSLLQTYARSQFQT